MAELSEEEHPYAFHVSGPRNCTTSIWRDILSSSWKEENYKRAVVACFTQAAYLVELDRQENRTTENALAPNWWLPFKYKLTRTLIDKRDGSIFGAILEWAGLRIARPSGAPKAVLALRGTLLHSSTYRRDLTDDLRFLTWESLKGSARFKIGFDALKSLTNRYGGDNVCIAGHSLGAGFALQIGKALAKQGIIVEAHLYNPPSVSLASSFKNIRDKAGLVWKRFVSMFSSQGKLQQGSISDEHKKAMKKWVPHLYVNSSDYVCCYYANPTQSRERDKNNSNGGSSSKPNNVAAKLFILSKGNQKFLDAHKLEQWWADDLKLQAVSNNGKLISRQLKSLYQLPASSQVAPVKQR